MQIKTKIVSCHTADSKPVKQEVNSTVILPPLVFPGLTDLIANVLLYNATLTAKLIKDFKKIGAQAYPIKNFTRSAMGVKS